MTSEQFDALAVLMGQPDSKSAAAARLVLVEGLSSADAARRGVRPRRGLDMGSRQ